ncbi:uncharacterized protein LOC142765030 [Rhipicephalus microplus]|uniref:uncharacterized protein LOC142765030 n=1 Tax=Rhipicephalus microplus TaxID=6941 RepID=UPI003F6C5A2A
MAVMLKITRLALVLTATGVLHNAGEAAVPEASSSISETPRNKTFKEFWTNFTKVWTANSTVPYYKCEWQEPKNITDLGLTIITHFEGRHYFTINWTFAENNTLTSKLPDGEITRSFVYQNHTCAVFKDQISWNITESIPKKHKPKKGKKRTKYTTGRTFQYRLVFFKQRNQHVSHDCRREYRKVIGNATNFRIYFKNCTLTQFRGNH